MIKDSNFQNLLSKNNFGGCIKFDNSFNEIYLNNVTFINCSSILFAGAIFNGFIK